MNKATALQKNQLTYQKIVNSYHQITGSITDKLKSLRGSNNLRRVQPKDNNSVRDMIQKILLKKGGVGFDQLYYDKD